MKVLPLKTKICVFKCSTSSLNKYSWRLQSRQGLILLGYLCQLRKHRSKYLWRASKTWYRWDRTAGMGHISVYSYPTRRLSLVRLVSYRLSYSPKRSYNVKDNGIFFFMSTFPHIFWNAAYWKSCGGRDKVFVWKPLDKFYITFISLFGFSHLSELAL